MASTATPQKRALRRSARDWLAQHTRKSSIPRARSSIRIIISGTAAACAT
jgi:hypothetical protein